MAQAICAILDKIRNKGACIHTVSKADSLMLELKSMLPEKDYTELSIARGHYLTGEGSSEFYDICNNLIKKHNMTITDISRLLTDRKPIPGLTDAQQREVQAIFDDGRAREAWQKVQDWLFPKAKRTLL